MLSLLDFKTKLQESGIRDFLSFLSMRDLVTRGRPLTQETIKNRRDQYAIAQCLYDMCTCDHACRNCADHQDMYVYIHVMHKMNNFFL